MTVPTIVLPYYRREILNGYNLAKVTQLVSDRTVTRTQEFWLSLYS